MAAKRQYDMEVLKKKRFLTRDELCCYLGGEVSLSTIANITLQPDFPALVRIGTGRGRVLIDREKFDQWIEDRMGIQARA